MTELPASASPTALAPVAGGNLKGKLELNAIAPGQKYAIEHEERLCPDGIDNYRTIDELERNHYADDSQAADKPMPKNRPSNHEVDVLVNGGFGGLLVAFCLMQASAKNILIVEKAADFRGVWYWNGYPGISCNIQSHLPAVLEEPDYLPTRSMPKGMRFLSMLGR
jgi:cyclohexanone monooxygenase